MANSQDKKETSDEEILRIAKERFDTCEEAEQENRRLALEDLEFLSGNQWPEQDKRNRELDGRPCLTVNRLPQFLRQITNDQRQNRPSIKVSPVDDKADIETAKIYQGLIRHIQVNSNADVAYDTAFEGAVGAGFGFFRIATDYCDPYSFDQEAKIIRIPDQFKVYLDPFSKEPDGSDAGHAFQFEDVPKDQFIAEYGESKLASENNWGELNRSSDGWIKQNSVRIAEYFYKEYKSVTLVQLSNGAVVEKSVITANNPLPPGITILNERIAQVPVVKWCKLNGHEILEKNTWPVQWIPIIPVYGNELNIDGKKIREGIIRHAKDPQRMLNYWITCETEAIALAPKAPFIAAEGQIPPEMMQMWQDANRRPIAVLEYKTTDHNGQLVAPPQRNVYEPPVQAITMARSQAADDIKSTTGIYDAALGARSSETSGIAIQRRNMQAQTSNFHFIDNLTRSLKHAGRILVDLIPHVYDTPRAARILGEDGEAEVIRINDIFERKGQKVKFDLGVGKYDVTVETGPSFATKRQEALAAMLDLTKANPQMWNILGDLMLKNMDVPGASEMAERVKKTLPPGLADDPNKQPLPPEAQAQMQQQMQMIDNLTQQLTAVSEEMKNKKLELESKERIELMKIERDYKLELLKLQGEAANEMMIRELNDIDRRQAMVGMNEPIESDFNQQMPDQQMPDFNQQPTGGLPPG